MRSPTESSTRTSSSRRSPRIDSSIPVSSRMRSARCSACSIALTAKGATRRRSASRRPCTGCACWRFAGSISFGHFAALAAARAVRDEAGQAWALNELGALHLCAGDPRKATEHLECALGLYEKLGDPAGRCATRHNLDSARRDVVPPAQIGASGRLHTVGGFVRPLVAGIVGGAVLVVLGFTIAPMAMSSDDRADELVVTIGQKPSNPSASAAATFPSPRRVRADSSASSIIAPSRVAAALFASKIWRRAGIRSGCGPSGRKSTALQPGSSGESISRRRLRRSPTDLGSYSRDKRRLLVRGE